MNTDITISIIIPIFNPDIKELEKCLQSVSFIVQHNMEVILIDDGSFRVDIKRACRSFVQKDSRFKYFYQKNKGVSAARNLGLSKAKGKFISFVDADDTINSGAINRLEIQYFRNADLVLFDVLELLPSKEERKREILSCDSGFVEKEEVIKCFIQTMRLSECWGKLYRADIIRANNITFPTGIKQGEDSIFNCMYFQHITNAYYSKEIFYKYRFTYSNTSLRFINNPLERLNDVLVNYKYELLLIQKSFEENVQKKYIDDIDCMYTDGFGSIMLLLFKYKLVDRHIKDFVKREIKPLILKDSKNIFKKTPKACIYDLLLRNNLWFAFKILQCFKRITI